MKRLLPPKLPGAGQVSTKPVPEEALIDEYCDLREKMKAWKPNLNPHAARFAEAGALILAFYEAHARPAAESIVAEGARYKLPITARQVKRWPINLAGFFRKIGRDAYLAMCPPNLGDIEKAIVADKRKLYIGESQTGIRKLGEPVRREAVEAKAAA